MTEIDLRERLASLRAPDEEAAGERAWPVVRAGFARREPRPRRRRLIRPVLVFAVVAAVIAAATSPPGRSVVNAVRDALGRERVSPSETALARLPAPGRLLVTSTAGPWIVHSDGGKRLLGRYREASWSPHGLYVAAAGRHELAALTPAGTVRWTITRAGPVRSPRWTGSTVDTRIAYLDGASLRVVGGDGRGDHVLGRSVQQVAPAWRPGEGFAVAYVDRGGAVVVRNGDSGRLLWRGRVDSVPRRLAWSRDGRRLLVLTRQTVTVLGTRGRRLHRREIPGIGAVAAASDGRVAVVRRAGPEQSEVLLLSPTLGQRRLLAAPGVLTDLAWSPDGRWLVVAWPSADQWLFLRPGRRQVPSATGVADQFRSAPGTFPEIAQQGWCCSD